MKNISEKTQSAKDAPKVEIEVKTPAPVNVKIEKGTTPAPKSKKAQGKKADAPKADSKAEPGKVDVSKVESLKISKELLDAKLAALDAKLTKEKMTTTKNGFYVTFGYFLCKTKSGKILTIQYHATLKSAKWLVWDDKGKVLTAEPIATLWKAHETAVNQF